MGRWIDVVTQYVKNFNGAGKDAWSDSFAPQQEVTLKALVTYNLDPVKDKLVLFRIYDAAGDLYAELTNKTSDFGIALGIFRIPSGDRDIVSVFGKWLVEAHTDLAGIHISDTVRFYVGWPVSLRSFLPTEYKWSAVTEAEKGKQYEVAFDIYTIMARGMIVTVEVVLTDELGVPVWRQPVKIGFANTTLPMNLSEPITSETISPKGILLDFGIIVPKWAFAGNATLHISIYTEVNGVVVALSPEAQMYVSIKSMTSWG
jgi:hypothetical protein